MRFSLASICDLCLYRTDPLQPPPGGTDHEQLLASLLRVRTLLPRRVLRILALTPPSDLHGRAWRSLVDRLHIAKERGTALTEDGHSCPSLVSNGTGKSAHPPSDGRNHRFVAHAERQPSRRGLSGCVWTQPRRAGRIYCLVCNSEEGLSTSATTPVGTDTAAAGCASRPVVTLSLSGSAQSMACARVRSRSPTSVLAQNSAWLGPRERPFDGKRRLIDLGSTDCGTRHRGRTADLRRF